MPLRLGTRASMLARWQAEWVASRLREQGVEVELVPISTTGDQQPGAIQTIGVQGIFTKEIQRALLDNRIDLAVHSLKDLPTGDVPGLCLTAVPPRGPVADVLVITKGITKGVGSLFCSDRNAAIHADKKDAPPPLYVVGTSSLRRRAQLLHVRPDWQMKDIRGNVESRLRKLHQGDFDAIVLAEAGLRRLGLEHEIGQVLPLDLMLPAVGQGALGLETRIDDAATRQIVATLDHGPTHLAVMAERAMLAALQGGCLAPIAAWARVDGNQLTLTGRVLSHDGRKRLDATDRIGLASSCGKVGSEAGSLLPPSGGGNAGERTILPSPFGRGTEQENGNWVAVASIAEQLGRSVAEALLTQGASALIDDSRRL